MDGVKAKYKILSQCLDERSRRLWAATEARMAGYGGISLVSRATGLSRVTLHQGLRELDQMGSAQGSPVEAGRSRKAGAGRKPFMRTQPDLMKCLKKLVEPITRGHPQSSLLWTCKSTRKLAQELGEQGFEVSHVTVADLLGKLGYSLQGNRKTKEGESHPQRNAQFEYIGEQVERFQESLQPVISVDTKKKELIGDFRNGGKEWRPEGNPEKVQVHDFEYKELGKGIPYGVYDLTANEGWVSVGTDHDTAEFAVATIERWWKKMGRDVYPNAKRILITADGGGSNGSRSKLWKLELQRLATQTGLEITVCHLPPGTSKWNKIEHRLFCHITQNWRARPLVSHQVMVNLIANTTTRTGLRVKAALDNRSYETGIQVSKEELASIKIMPAKFQGEWNYTIKP